MTEPAWPRRSKKPRSRPVKVLRKGELVVFMAGDPDGGPDLEIRARIEKADLMRDAYDKDGGKLWLTLDIISKDRVTR